MKRTLTLMRHAKSSWKDDALHDHDRPLNRRGEKAAQTMACRLRQRGYVPDLVLVSSAARTQLTAEALLQCYDGKPEHHTSEALYEASVPDIVDVIRGVDASCGVLMLIGHNPAMQILTDALAGKHYDMPTAAYICFEITQPWHAFDLHPCSVLDYDFPKSQV